MTDIYLTGEYQEMWKITPLPEAMILSYLLCQLLLAVQRGPLVYCFEETDNGKNIPSIILPPKARGEVIMDKTLGGFAGIKIPAQRLINEAADLYHTQKSSMVPFTAYAVPYSYMENRKTGEMAVWLTRKI